MVPRWRFLRPVFSASRVQQVSDLHLKFALKPRRSKKLFNCSIQVTWTYNAITRLSVQLPAIPLSCDDPWQVVHPHLLLSQGSIVCTGQMAVKFGGWEINLIKSGMADSRTISYHQSRFIIHIGHTMSACLSAVPIVPFW